MNFSYSEYDLSQKNIVLCYNELGYEFILDSSEKLKTFPQGERADIHNKRPEGRMEVQLENIIPSAKGVVKGE